MYIYDPFRGQIVDEESGEVIEERIEVPGYRDTETHTRLTYGDEFHPLYLGSSRYYGAQKVLEVLRDACGLGRAESEDEVRKILKHLEQYSGSNDLYLAIAYVICGLRGRFVAIKPLSKKYGTNWRKVLSYIREIKKYIGVQRLAGEDDSVIVDHFCGGDTACRNYLSRVLSEIPEGRREVLAFDLYYEYISGRLAGGVLERHIGGKKKG